VIARPASAIHLASARPSRPNSCGLSAPEGRRMAIPPPWSARAPNSPPSLSPYIPRQLGGEPLP
jgi:hypothetical protein